MIGGGEELPGPAAPKMARLMCFIGAGVVCVFAINKLRDLERKSILQQEKQQQQLSEHLLPLDKSPSSNALPQIVD